MFRKIVNACVKVVQKYLPEPFIFALLLTFVAFIIAMPVCRQTPMEVLNNWGSGIWSLLAFSMQMALVLVCGSALADAPAIKKGLEKLSSLPKRAVSAIALVSFVSALACWINWGFGLIIGVVFAKSIARKLKGVDYRLLIASAYSGFVVWHGGISGSVPLSLATPGEALSKATMGVVTEPIPISETIFSGPNILISIICILALTVVNSLMHPKGKDVVEALGAPDRMVGGSRPRLEPPVVREPAAGLDRRGAGFLVQRRGDFPAHRVNTIARAHPLRTVEIQLVEIASRIYPRKAISQLPRQGTVRRRKNHPV